MCYRNPGGISDRNKYGAFVCTYDANNMILDLIQLFKNRELWGIDAYSIVKQHCMEHAKVDFGFFPCVAFENNFIVTLDNYLKFAAETLKFALPLHFIAGASDVGGYRMTQPSGSRGFSKFGGSVMDNHILYEGQITDYSHKETYILRPFFDYVWEECGLERPDVERLK